jgi:hypothetical protein
MKTLTPLTKKRRSEIEEALSSDKETFASLREKLDDLLFAHDLWMLAVKNATIRDTDAGAKCPFCGKAEFSARSIKHDAECPYVLANL